jgi:protein-tyrosine phosphatase
MGDGQISEILPNELYLSGLHCRNDEEALSQYEITIICDLSNTQNPLPEYNGIQYYKFSIIDRDTENISLIMNEVYEIFLRKGSQKMLIHCQHGISRSATCVIFCLMKSRQFTLKQSFQLVKSIRSVALPNVGFMNQLITAERELFGEVSLEMGKYGQFLWLT